MIMPFTGYYPTSWVLIPTISISLNAMGGTDLEVTFLAWTAGISFQPDES